MAKQRAGAEAARAAKAAKEAKEKSLKEAESAKKAAKEKASKKVRSSSKFPDEETLKKAKGKKGTTKKATVSPQGIRVSPPRAAKRRASSVTSPSGGTSKKLKFTEASRKSPSKRDPDKNKKRGKGSPKTTALETPETAAGKPPTQTGKKVAERKDGPEVSKPGEKPTPTTVETQELEAEKEGGQKKGPEDPKPGERSTATADETTRKEGAQEEEAEDPKPGKKSSTTPDEPQEPKTGKDGAQEEGADDPQPGKKSNTTPDEPQEPKTGKDEAQEKGPETPKSVTGQPDGDSDSEDSTPPGVDVKKLGRFLMGYYTRGFAVTSLDDLIYPVYPSSRLHNLGKIQRIRQRAVAGRKGLKNKKAPPPIFHFKLPTGCSLQKTQREGTLWTEWNHRWCLLYFPVYSRKRRKTYQQSRTHIGFG